jgi:hypothetical protein
VNLVDEEDLKVARTLAVLMEEVGPSTYTWHDLGLALFSPLRHLGVDLLSQFGLDLSGVAFSHRCQRQRK